MKIIKDKKVSQGVNFYKEEVKFSFLIKSGLRICIISRILCGILKVRSYHFSI